MSDAPPDDHGLTPPGPPIDPPPDPPPADSVPRAGGLSLEDWLATQQAVGRPVPTPGPASAPNPYATPPSTRWRELDRVSVWSFALGLTGCAAPIAVVLGVLGLRRTSDGRFAGRWAAITGVVLGLIGTVGIGLGAWGSSWFRESFPAVGALEVGDCVDYDDQEEPLSLHRTDCSDPHDAEVAAAGEFEATAYAADEVVFCARAYDDAYDRAARSGRYVVTLVAESSADELQPGDSYACLLTRTNGRALDGPIAKAGERDE